MLLQTQRIGESVTTPAIADSIEELRQILATRQQIVSYDEAGEIADALVEFYEVLAGEVDNEPIC